MRGISLLAGIDLGTTACKAAVYDTTGAIQGEGSAEYALFTPEPGVVEQDPAAWWDGFCAALRGALAQSGDPQRVQALAISSQGIAFVLADAAGQPLGNALSWLDTRATEETAEVVARYRQEDLYRITGKRIEACYVLPKLLWLRRRRPQAWAQARHVLMVHDYLLARLCGVHVTDHTLAGGTLLYSLADQGWDPALLEAFGISAALLPEIHWAGTPAGSLCAVAAEALGLPPGIQVVVGGQDQKCAAFAAGIGLGLATVSLGTASAISQLVDRPTLDPQMRIPAFSSLQPGAWVLEGVIGTAGGALRWYRDLLAPGMAYAALEAEAAAVPPGARGAMFLPHLSGATSPHWKAGANGAFYGLSLATRRADMTRAVLEGVAYALRANLAVTQELAGTVRELVLFGGGARSPLWRQIVADVTGLPVAYHPSAETASLGAAMLAGAGCGAFASPAEARAAMAGRPAVQEPDAARVRLYEGAYSAHREFEDRLLAHL